MSKNHTYNAERLVTPIIRSTAAFGCLVGKLLRDQPSEKSSNRKSGNQR